MSYQESGLILTKLRPDWLKYAEDAREAAIKFRDGERVQKQREALAAMKVAHLPKKPFVVQNNNSLAVMMVGTELGLMVSDLMEREMTLTNAGIWVALVSPQALPFTYSQKWHRDPFPLNAVITKVFWHIGDVDLDTGPFEYITGTMEQPKKVRSLAERYVPDEEQASYDTHPNRVVCTGPADTMIVANTAGLHKGGRCNMKERHTIAFEYMGFQEGVV